jgi:hypothetical protein
MKVKVKISPPSTYTSQALTIIYLVHVFLTPCTHLRGHTQFLHLFIAMYITMHAHICIPCPHTQPIYCWVLCVFTQKHITDNFLGQDYIKLYFILPDDCIEFHGTWGPWLNWPVTHRHHSTFQVRTGWEPFLSGAWSKRHSLAIGRMHQSSCDVIIFCFKIPLLWTYVN